MSEAQLESYGSKRKQIQMSNDQVFQLFRSFKPDEREPTATAEQLIAFFTASKAMSAIEGKRISQPIYRALSEGAAAGILDDDQKIENPDTGSPNTLYKLLLIPRTPKPKDDTWKQRALKAEAALAELKTKYEVCSETVDKQILIIEKQSQLIAALQGIQLSAA